MVGRMVGNYRVVRKLGAGGTGVVYAAEHPEIGKKVALKVLQADLAEGDGLPTRETHVPPAWRADGCSLALVVDV